MSEKMTGYALLAGGILLIAFAAFSVYSVFTARATPVELFKFDGVSLPVSALMGGSESPLPVSDEEIEIFPSEVLNQTTNTFAHLFLMGFLASIGFKVASLGTSLLKPVIVKVGEKKITSVLDPK